MNVEVYKSLNLPFTFEHLPGFSHRAWRPVLRAARRGGEAWKQGHIDQSQTPRVYWTVNIQSVVHERPYDCTRGHEDAIPKYCGPPRPPVLVSCLYELIEWVDGFKDQRLSFKRASGLLYLVILLGGLRSFCTAPCKVAWRSVNSATTIDRQKIIETVWKLFMKIWISLRLYAE